MRMFCGNLILISTPTLLLNIKLYINDSGIRSSYKTFKEPKKGFKKASFLKGVLDRGVPL